MTLSRLQIEKVRPATSSRVNTPRKIKTQGKNTPRAETFKNPLLGIEVNLRQKLNEVNEQYHDTSYRKRNILMDALEDIANSKTGFNKQILDVLSVWKPPPSDHETYRTTALADLMRQQKELRKVASNHQQVDDNIRKMKQDIQMAYIEAEEYKEKIEDLKVVLMKQSDHFALARKLTSSLKELQESFNEIFTPPKEREDTEEVKNLLLESAQLRKDRTRMLYELNIAKQISKRLELNELSSDDND
ncbi:hypothetical protein TRFO_04444 [Tritrichomonas foetus]|uniref:Uncharacterized protein n=1 Tax=Tritrichomonas foetus TaxID=1144522 RepID=A0A1J4KEM2_9EUKA|nr:hypothetical protein TRFO_04444 [Tritrichomonas foetus]|eukprot:OHT09895.1 hypothetical protein TRFO_04444 [Tritrichomonas foetus]